ncbi:MAG TPA: VOC family protein [Candidatus Salinicoccus stercoripullorum]|uniref:VOC family protein n=1 Tax=Candidatus Salinicoccus stercoripullorum TaxID=2838756 RepID=A0A9D1QJ33_9STAP|nr:VOC family protein [Candidatus Salinicoccus stercoripullorum]
MVKFDHIIHYVNQLEEVEKSPVLPIHSGGRHERFGTSNLLSYFDYRYVEYLAIENEEAFSRHLEEGGESFAGTIDALGYEEGFIRYALSTDDIKGLAERFLASGFAVHGPVEMERVTDGETISWKLLYVGSGNEIFPFFIEWDEPEQERLKRIEALRGKFIRPSITIRQEVTDIHVWEAFYDVLGIWEGEIDSLTRVVLSQNKEPSITMEVGMDGESAIYKGAIYKFI